MKNMNRDLKEAIGYFIVALVFFFVVTDAIFPYIIISFKVCLYLIGGILSLASIGSISNYLGRSKNEKPDRNESVNN